jgi:hypothetical protein
MARFLRSRGARALNTMSKNCEQISELIVSYLGTHHEAQDTLDGIVNWWLTFERIEQSTHAVADILEGLLRQGIITMRVSGDGAILYKLKKDN